MIGYGLLPVIFVVCWTDYSSSLRTAALGKDCGFRQDSTADCTVCPMNHQICGLLNQFPKMSNLYFSSSGVDLSVPKEFPQHFNEWTFEQCESKQSVREEETLSDNSPAERERHKGRRHEGSQRKREEEEKDWIQREKNCCFCGKIFETNNCISIWNILNSTTGFLQADKMFMRPHMCVGVCLGAVRLTDLWKVLL